MHLIPRTHTDLFTKIFFLALLGMLLFFAPLAHAQGSVTITAQAGLDNLCKAGMWLPVKITVENSGADVEARVQAAYTNDLSGKTIYGADGALPSTSR